MLNYLGRPANFALFQLCFYLIDINYDSVISIHMYSGKFKNSGKIVYVN